MSKIYEVTILPFTTTTTEQNGFIEDKRIEERVTDISTVTYAQCEAKWRGMERWQQLAEGLSLIANPTILSTEAVGATATTDATSFVFTMKFDREGSMRITREGVEMVDADAVKQLVAEILSTTQKKICGVVEPANGVIVRTVDLEIGALGTLEVAKTKITVTIS